MINYCTNCVSFGYTGWLWWKSKCEACNGTGMTIPTTPKPKASSAPPKPLWRIYS